MPDPDRLPAADGDWPPPALRCAGLAIAGLLLALLAVWLGTGWLDGFDYRGVNKLGRRFLRALPWALPLAAAGGMLLYGYFRWALAERHKGWVTLLAVLRAFALFPFLGFAMLFAMIFGFVAAIAVGVWHKLARRPPAEGADGSFFPGLLVPLLWMMTLPFTLLKIQSQGDIEIPARVPPARLLRWLPILFLMLLVGPGFESESTGERVDPNWLAALAAYWLADCLIVAGHVAPLLARQARAARVAELRRGT